jgi:hypothetical protein
MYRVWRCCHQTKWKSKHTVNVALSRPSKRTDVDFASRLCFTWDTF